MKKESQYEVVVKNFIKDKFSKVHVVPTPAVIFFFVGREQVMNYRLKTRFLDYDLDFIQNIVDEVFELFRSISNEMRYQDYASLTFEAISEKYKIKITGREEY